MARFNSTSDRKTVSPRDCVAWGRINLEQNSTVVFAALLVACSLAVGCSSEKPKTQSVNIQTPIAQSAPLATTPVASVTSPAETAKPMRKKVVHKVPPTVAYADKYSGVSFRYPRKYVLKAGDDSEQLASKEPIQMTFVQPGGIAVAAVAIPEGVYPKSDLASAMFDVGMNKSLTAEQCGTFLSAQSNAPRETDDNIPVATAPAATPAPNVPRPKLMIGDMELYSNETVVNVGSRKETSRYYHVFENDVCYEFALRVATTGETDEGGKPVDQDEVFNRLGKILATVKINPLKTSDVTASVPAASTATGTPAQ